MTSPTVTPAIPPLRDGDRLTRDEFERRYHAMPHVKKAELIYGVVYMPSPVSHDRHGGPHFDIIGWLAIYRALTPGVDGGDNSSVRLPGDNEPQPDVSLFILPGRGGQVTMSDDGGYLEGAPELVVEVSASSAPLDRGPKMRLYRENNVREYLIWLVDRGEVEWHVLRAGQYQRLAPHADGTLRSEAFPGLWLDPAALIARDLARVLAVVQQGLASPEHAAFVQQLRPAAP